VSFMTERAFVNQIRGGASGWLPGGDGRAGAECFQSFIRPRGAGRSVVRRLEGSIKVDATLIFKYPKSHAA
jgi:hypothetical protein